MEACSPHGVRDIMTDFNYSSNDVLVTCEDGEVKRLEYDR